MEIQLRCSLCVQKFPFERKKRKQKSEVSDFSCKRFRQLQGLCQSPKNPTQSNHEHCTPKMIALQHTQMQQPIMQSTFRPLIQLGVVKEGAVCSGVPFDGAKSREGNGLESDRGSLTSPTRRVYSGL